MASQRAIHRINGILFYSDFCSYLSIGKAIIVKNLVVMVWIDRVWSAYTMSLNTARVHEPEYQYRNNDVAWKLQTIFMRQINY